MNKKINFRFIVYFGFTILLLVLCILFTKQYREKEDDFIISVIFPLTGDTGAAMANNVKNSLIMCAESFNAQGGVNGKKIKIEFYDAKNASSREGVDIANRLIASKKNNIVITMISNVVMSVNPILEKNRILNLAIASSGDLFKNPKKYTLRTHLSAKETGTAIADAIKNKFHKKNVKVIYANTEFGNTSLRAFLNAAKNLNLTSEVVAFEEKELSYRSSILKLNLKNEDIVYVIGIQESLGRLVRQLKEHDFSGRIIGGPDLNSFLARDTIGENNSNIYYIETMRTKNFVQFNEDFKNRFSEDMDEIAVLAYTGLSTVLKCFNEIKTNDVEFLMKKINGFKSNEYMGDVTFIENEMIIEFKISKL